MAVGRERRKRHVVHVLLCMTNLSIYHARNPEPPPRRRPFQPSERDRFRRRGRIGVSRAYVFSGAAAAVMHHLFAPLFGTNGRSRSSSDRSDARPSVRPSVRGIERGKDVNPPMLLWVERFTVSALRLLLPTLHRWRKRIFLRHIEHDNFMLRVWVKRGNIK